MRAHTSLLAAFVAAIIALTACTDPGPAGRAPTKRNAPERDGSDHGGSDHGGGDHGGGGGGMM